MHPFQTGTDTVQSRLPAPKSLAPALSSWHDLSLGGREMWLVSGQNMMKHLFDAADRGNQVRHLLSSAGIRFLRAVRFGWRCWKCDWCGGFVCVCVGWFKGNVRGNGFRVKRERDVFDWLIDTLVHKDTRFKRKSVVVFFTEISLKTYTYNTMNVYNIYGSHGNQYQQHHMNY